MTSPITGLPPVGDFSKYKIQEMCMIMGWWCVDWIMPAHMDGKDTDNDSVGDWERCQFKCQVSSVVSQVMLSVVMFIFDWPDAFAVGMH